MGHDSTLVKNYLGALKYSCVFGIPSVLILGESKDATARELLEAFHINARGPSCINDMSVSLLQVEKRFFDKWL